MVDDAKELLELLRQRLVPSILQMGFELAPLPDDDRNNAEMMHVFPLGYMKRRRSALVDVIELQLDRHGRAKFVVNFGTVPPEGVTLPWARLSQDEASASDLEKAYRLFSKQGSQEWFSPQRSLWNAGGSSRLMRIVDRAVMLLPEIEDWFRNGKWDPTCS
jgi:hypothetical protein